MLPAWQNSFFFSFEPQFCFCKLVFPFILILYARLPKFLSSVVLQWVSSWVIIYHSCIATLSTFTFLCISALDEFISLPSPAQKSSPPLGSLTYPSQVLNSKAEPCYTTCFIHCTTLHLPLPCPAAYLSHRSQSNGRSSKPGTSKCKAGMVTNRQRK